MASTPSCTFLRRSVTSLLRRRICRRSDVRVNRNISHSRVVSVVPRNIVKEVFTKNPSAVLRTGQFERFSSNSTPAKAKPVVPVFLRADKFGSRTAVVTHHGQYTYEDLINYSANLAHDISTFIEFEKSGGKPKRPAHGAAHFGLQGMPLAGERVAFLCENDLSYVVAQWATWLCDAVAVPLCKVHPVNELKYFVQDSGAALIMCTEAYKDKLHPVSEELGVPLHVIPEDAYSGDYDPSTSAWEGSLGVGENETLKHRFTKGLKNNSFKNKRAIIIYTSGTTGRPKVS